MPVDPEPDATSTPTWVPHVTGRKAIRSDDHNYVQSPIEGTTYRYNTRSNIASERSVFDESLIRKSPGQSPKKTSQEKRTHDEKHLEDRTRSYDFDEYYRFSDGECISSDDGVGDKRQEQVRESREPDPGKPIFIGQSPKKSTREKRTHNEQHVDDRSGSYDFVDDNQFSDGERISSDDDGVGDKRHEQVRETSKVVKSGKPILTGFVLGCAGIVAACLLALFFSPSSDLPPSDLPQRFISLEKEFKRQGEDFWRNIRVNINEIPVLDQPQTIIFLYNNRAEKTLDKILRKVSAIALCSLSECSNKPIIIEGASLNTSEVVNDYGKIISKYREDLKKTGVMIVRNLEKVPGVSAQAFHSFCDTYNPVVKRALILFTVKVEKLPEGYPMKFIEQLLLNLWSDIDRDSKFYPLFTRISGTILPVKPE